MLKKALRCVIGSRYSGALVRFYFWPLATIIVKLFAADNMNQPSQASPTPPAPSTFTESLYEAERRQKLQKIRDLGLDPYGIRTDGLQALAAVKAPYAPEMGHDGGPGGQAAGRVMLKRDMGKLSFLTLRDESGDLQVALDKKRLDAKPTGKSAT